jgi:hypothetical protein
MILHTSILKLAFDSDIAFPDEQAFIVSRQIYPDTGA